jgi:pyridoxamine 5'-phosphate oxidase
MAGVPDFPPLHRDDLDPNPVRQFKAWFDQAEGSGERAPEAAAVATATSDGAPSVRMVLVKQVDDDGFVFYTNYQSRKGRELSDNPRAALLFHWDLLGRQVRTEGRVERASADETAAYVRSRPRASQLSALASAQSHVVDSRERLENRVAELAAEYRDRDLPVPASWGGFRLVPDAFEFWQHRADRLHDRFVYTLSPEGGWRIERIAP